MLHGGPGGGSNPGLRRFHDPSQWLIVTYDQRGAGKSRPHCELRENTTQELVNDLERLRKHLGLGKLHLFGGSWGSTLALAYAEKYPRQVSSLVLRGIFLGTREELDHFYHGGAGAFFPEAYARLQTALPHPEQHDYPQQLLTLLVKGDEAAKTAAARAWVRYEAKLASLSISDEEVEAILDSFDVKSAALLENYYMANRCFLKEGELLNGAAALAGIPTIIVHGRQDVICRPVMAYRLHQRIPGSRLVMVEAAGHIGGSPPMRAALVTATREIEATVLARPATQRSHPDAQRK